MQMGIKDTIGNIFVPPPPPPPVTVVEGAENFRFLAVHESNMSRVSLTG